MTFCKFESICKILNHVYVSVHAENIYLYKLKRFHFDVEGIT